MNKELKIGFIGLGIMGGPMAKHIISAGYPVTVFTKTQSKLNQYAELGASIATCPADCAKNSDIVITCLPENETVRAVVFDNPDSIAKGAKPGLIVADASTIEPKAARTFAQMAEEQGFIFLDSPVTGGEIGAIEGKLAVMVGGNEDAFNIVKPVLETTARLVVRVGESGQGQMLKMANQIAGMLNMVGVAESLMFCRKAGIDLNLAINVIGSGASGSAAMNNLAKQIVERDFTPGFSIALQQKDMKYAMAAAEEIKAPMPAASVCNQLFQAIMANGEGHLTFSAVTLIIEKLAGLDLPATYNPKKSQQGGLGGNG